MSAEQRFWAKVNKTDGCWLWTASKIHNGYGRFWVGERAWLAHRLSWTWANGPIPQGEQVDHMCHNKGCVKPAHMRLLSHAHNQQNLTGAHANSKSGVRGVRWDSHRKKWRAEAMLNRKHYSLGYYLDIQEATEAVTAWRREHMPYSIKDQEPEGSFFMPQTKESAA